MPFTKVLKETRENIENRMKAHNDFYTVVQDQIKRDKTILTDEKNDKLRREYIFQNISKCLRNISNIDLWIPQGNNITQTDFQRSVSEILLQHRMQLNQDLQYYKEKHKVASYEIKDDVKKGLQWQRKKRQAFGIVGQTHDIIKRNDARTETIARD